jgi:hypothetical protein
MQIYISLVSGGNVEASCLFDIKLTNPISQEFADYIFCAINNLVDDYKEYNIFCHLSTLSIISNLIGENGQVTLDANLEYRTIDEINHFMKNVIENYDGFEFFIVTDENRVTIMSTDEGSTDHIKQYLCA